MSLEKNTYGDVQRNLFRLKMTRVSQDTEWKGRHMAKTDVMAVEALGILRRPIVPREVERRGRTKGGKDAKPREKKGNPPVASRFCMAPLSEHFCRTVEWWARPESNRRPPPCKGGVITPKPRARWSPLVRTHY